MKQNMVQNPETMGNEGQKQAEGLKQQVGAQKQQAEAGKDKTDHKKFEKKGLGDDKVGELTNTLQRVQAEFENYQKRNQKQIVEFTQVANASLLEQLLPILDSLEQGMQHNKEFIIIYEQLFGVLKKNGLQKIHAERGQAFDHDKMECLMQESDPKIGEGKIVNVLINGYTLNGKILRPAKVSVSSGAGKKVERESQGNQSEKKEDFEKRSGDKENKGKEQLTKIEYEVKKMESD